MYYSGALQDIWPNGTCYGCGPANPHGLQIKSHWAQDDSGVTCVFTPKPHHNAGFDNVMYGGMLASLCDCHSIWTAIAYTYRHERREHGSRPAISYVTGNLNVSYLAPTPLDQPIMLRAHAEEISGRKAKVYCAIFAGEKKTVEARVLAIRIAEDKSLGASHLADGNRAGG
jgi:acyl-coenzyme A thioesterase PaaI-like protein